MCDRFEEISHPNGENKETVLDEGTFVRDKRRCFVLANPLSLQHKSCSFETATSSWGIAHNSGL